MSLEVMWASISMTLKDINSNNSADFIYIDKIGIIVTIHITASDQDIKIIEKAIKNSKKINNNSVKSPWLLKSKSYLKILGLSYFSESTNKLITSQIVKEVFKKSYIFKDIEFSSKL